MIENPMRRVAAIMLTALLLFSTVVVVFPQGTASAASETNDIVIPVRSGTDIATKATVILTEVHNGTQFTATFSSATQKYVVSNAPSGHYVFIVTASGNYTERNVTGFRHDGLSKIEINTVILEQFPTMSNNYSITVKEYGTGNTISGATVSFYNWNTDYDQTVVSKSTGSSGQTYINVFSSTSMDLVVSKAGYEMNVTRIADTSSPTPMTIYLNKSATVIGELKLKNGDSVENIAAHMINTNTSYKTEKRVLDNANPGSWLFKFYAYPSNWALILDGSNADPIVINIPKANLTTGGTTDLGTILMEAQNKSVESDEMAFSDWNNLTIWSNSTWKADRTYPGLPFSDMGCLRAQIDVALGDKNGVIDGSEYSDFYNDILLKHDPKYITTSNLIHLNNTLYWNPSVQVPTITNFNGDSIGDVSDILYNQETDYVSKNTLTNSGSYYLARFNATYDSSTTDHTYQVMLVNNGITDSYELVYNQTGTSKVTVFGYTVLQIEPTYSSTPGVAVITLNIEKSQAPVAKGEIIDTPDTYIRMYNNTVLGYVVKFDRNITFSSSKTTDANGNPLTFVWEFGDGASNTTMKTTVYHNYTKAKNCTVNLTVTDIVGKTNMTKLNVSVDNRIPRPLMVVMSTTGGAKSSPYRIDQGATLKFSPSGSKDDLLALNDGWGTIYSYAWKFGADAPHQNLASLTDQNETYTFNTAGNINVTLNVTDVVGNWKNTTVSIKVNDTSEPYIGTLKMLNSSWGITLLERSLIYFDATGTTDNVDNISALNFNWTFGDGSAKIGGVGLSYANVSHNYSSYGQYTLYLNVTDKSGNNVSEQRTIYVGMGDRPDVNVEKISFEPKTLEEGVSGRIIANLTNSGSAVAKNIKVEIWWYSGAIAQKRIGNVTTIYDENGTKITSLKVGQSGYVYLDWIPDAKGNYSIRVNATADDQPQSNWDVSNVEVKQASWKDIVLPIGILVIIIVVPLLLLARRRMGSMGTMMKRPKKEKEVKEKKEEK